MGNNTHWTIEDFKKAGLIKVGESYVPASSQVAKGKVEKLPLLVSIEKETKPVNKKIRNATKLVVNDVKFDSKLEAYFYSLLVSSNIEFHFQKKFVLQDKFIFNREAIRELSIIIDFWLPTKNRLIDTKGWQTYDGKINHKLLKKYLVNTYPGKEIIIDIPKNKKECDILIANIIYA
jgi:hypothetical protein